MITLTDNKIQNITLLVDSLANVGISIKYQFVDDKHVRINGLLLARSLAESKLKQLLKSQQALLFHEEMVKLLKGGLNI